MLPEHVKRVVLFTGEIVNKKRGAKAPVIYITQLLFIEFGTELSQYHQCKYSSNDYKVQNDSVLALFFGIAF